MKGEPIEPNIGCSGLGIFFPALVVRHKDGSMLVKPGKPVVREFVSAVEASKLLGLSVRRIQAMCQSGEIAAEQPSGPKGKYKIPMAEITRMRDII